jgi:hypothetical protein
MTDFRFTQEDSEYLAGTNAEAIKKANLEKKELLKVLDEAKVILNILLVMADEERPAVIVARQWLSKHGDK